ERISGLPADTAPGALAVTHPQQRREVSAFSTLLTPHLLHELDSYAHTFLDQHGASGEPVTWTPSATNPAAGLPGTPVSHLPIDETHHPLRHDRLPPRTIAAHLGITTDAIRCALNDQPAPLTARQQRASGRLAWTLAEHLPATELRRLHHQQHLSVGA